MNSLDDDAKADAAKRAKRLLKVWKHRDPRTQYEDFPYPKNRYWFYGKDEWEPDHRWRPERGGDEWCRHTIVLPVPFKGYIVIALWECRDKDCDACVYDCERV